MTAKVFISYRRDDSAGYSGRVRDRLERELGRDLLFMDVDAIPLGRNFAKVLHNEVAKCSVLLAMIGPNWADARDEHGNRRVDDPKDFVRIEIAAALQRDIPVIPILLDGARIPKTDQLPEDLKELASRAGLDVRHASFHSDMDRLIGGLKEQLGQADAPRGVDLAGGYASEVQKVRANGAQSHLRDAQGMRAARPEVTEIADRQSLWSTTAATLKKRAEIARWLTFAFLILGALLAAIASQLNDPLRLYFAIAGAVLLANVNFVTSRLLGSAQITSWLRARTASEALKGEAYRYAASAKPYDDPQSRDAALNAERERIEHDVDDLLALAVGMVGPGSSPRAPLSREAYVAGRVRNQINNFYLPRADANKGIAMSLRWAEFSLALAAPIITAVVGLAGKDLFGLKFDFLALTAVLTTIAGAVLAHIEASRSDLLVMVYRATARRLSAELSKIGDVSALSRDDWSDFVNRCEAIIAEENTSWAAKWTKA